MSDTPFYTVTLSDIAFRYETQLAAFFDGSSDAARAFNDEPTSITSSGVIWGNSTDGVILDSSINYTASIDQLLDAIENGLETEQFRSFSIYDSGNKIFELEGSATDWSITSDDTIINLSGDLPTNMSDFVEFAENLSKIPDFIGYQENWNYDWQLGGWNIDRTTLYDLPVTERNEVIYELRPYNIDRLTIRKDQEVDIWLLSGSGEPDQHLGKFTPNLELDYSYILADDLEIAAEIQYITLGRKDFGDLINTSGISLLFEDELSAFSDGSSAAAKSLTYEPTSITSNGVVWGTTSNGVILDSAINYSSSIEVLSNAINDGLETGQFRSLSIRDAGNTIFELSGSATEWSVKSGDVGFVISGNLPTSMSGLLDFVGYMSKIPDFLGIESGSVWDEQTQQWIYTKTTPLGLSVSERNDVIDGLRPYDIDRFEILPGDDFSAILTSEAGTNLDIRTFFPEIAFDFSYIDLAQSLEILAETQYIELGQKDLGDLISFSDISFRYENELSEFFEGTSPAAIAFGYQPTSITSNGVIWGSSTNGVFLDSSITNISTLDELTSSIENGLETGQFRSLSVYDDGQTIFELSGSATEWSIASDDTSLKISGDLPTSMSGLLDFLGNLSKIPDFLGIESGSVWDEQTQQWIYTKTTPLGLSVSERNDVIDGLRPYDIDRLQILKDESVSVSIVSESGLINEDIGSFTPELELDFSFISLAETLERLSEIQNANLSEREFIEISFESDQTNYNSYNWNWDYNNPITFEGLKVNTSVFFKASATTFVDGTHMFNGFNENEVYPTQVQTFELESGHIAFVWAMDIWKQQPDENWNSNFDLFLRLANPQTGEFASQEIRLTDDYEGDYIQSVNQNGSKFNIHYSNGSDQIISIDLRSLITGGIQDQVENFEVDTLAPVISTIVLSDTALKAGDTSTVTFTFSEELTGFSADDVTVANGALSNFTVTSDAKVYTATYTPTADVEDTTNVISVGTDWTDAAGNAPTAATDSSNYAVDTRNPNLTVTSADATSGLSGTSEAGAAISVTITDPSGTSRTLSATADDTNTGAWNISSADILGSEVTSEDNGTYAFSVTASDAAGNSSEAATASLVLQVNSTPSGSITISGATTEGQVLTADTSSLADADDLGTLSYQWLRDGADISGATSSTYTLAPADVGASISARVSYTDNGGTA
ncbi:Ig-like domain-containing protein, partial [Rhodobacteraceae bacterium]|nr:Ig-like domain-containing protein [Paracoccaceae bacterium]